MFKKVSKTESYETYVNLNFKTHRLSHDLEEMFLSNEITSDQITILDKKINEVKSLINDFNKNAD